MTVLFFFLSFHLFFVMFKRKQQNSSELSPIIEAKALLSNGDVKGAFVALKKAAENGDVMACYDCGFMMIQGIGCKEDWKEGLELMEKGMKLEKESLDMNWRLCGSVSELIEPQSMVFESEFSFLFFIKSHSISFLLFVEADFHPLLFSCLFFMSVYCCVFQLSVL